MDSPPPADLSAPDVAGPSSAATAPPPRPTLSRRSSAEWVEDFVSLPTTPTEGEGPKKGLGEDAVGEEERKEEMGKEEDGNGPTEEAEGHEHGHEHAKVNGEAEPEDGEDDRICRICLTGEDPAMGRLFSPCLCAGTMRHVHVSCLHQWRVSSRNKTAFYKCSQCGYRYHFSRTMASNLSTNPIILLLLTLTLFTLLLFLAGYLGSYVLTLSPPLESSLPSASSPESVTDVLLYTSGPAAYFSMAKQAVQLFSEPSTLLQTSPGAAEPPPALPAFGRRLARHPDKAGDHSPQPAARRRDSMLYRFAKHLSLGFSVVGIFSFLSLAFTFPFFSPLNIRTLRPSPARRGAGPDRIASLFLVLFVVIGVVRTLTALYFAVRKLAERALFATETAILEVGAEDRRRAAARRTPPPGGVGRWARTRAWLLQRVGHEDD